MPQIAVDAKSYLGQWVDIIIDRPIGSYHPSGMPQYPINYGFVPNTVAGDGHEQDAYVLGVVAPLDIYHGFCVAVIQRLNDVEDKLVVVPDEAYAKVLSDKDILQATEFIEQYFDIKLIRYFES